MNEGMDKIDIRPMCHRVLVDDQATALPPSAACLRHGVVARVIFVRHDGWALGAPEHLEALAYLLWPDQWMTFGRWPEYDSIPIEFYRPPSRCRREESMETPQVRARLAQTDRALIHLLDQNKAACGTVAGHPCDWPTEPVKHTWVRLERAWMITCPKCQQVAKDMLAAGRKA